MSLTEIFAMDSAANEYFTSEQAFSAYLGTMQTTQRMLTVIANVFGLDGQEAVHPSLQAFFDFTALGVSLESQNIQAVMEDAKEVKIEKAEQKKKDRVTEAYRDDAREGLRESREQLLTEMQSQQQFGNFDFTHGDLEEALDEVIDNNKTWAKERGFTEAEADRALEMAILMKDMTPEEREQFLQEQMKTDPKIAKQFIDDAKVINEHHGNKIEVTSQTVKQANRAQEILSQGDITAKPRSQITSNFTDEVAGVGANAQSFILDDTPEIAPIAKEPEPFVLDA